MPLTDATLSQDTTVLALAGDGLTLVPGWAAALIALALAAVMVVLLMLLVEMRRMSSAWGRFLSSAEERSRPLVEHVNAAARNLEHITEVARTDIDRVNRAFTGLADGVAEAAEELRNAEESLEIVGRLLGHTTTTTTKRYAHLADGPLRAATERFSSKLDALSPHQTE